MSRKSNETELTSCDQTPSLSDLRQIQNQSGLQFQRNQSLNTKRKELTDEPAHKKTSNF